MPYGCKFEDLLTILRERAPAKADAVAVHRRRTEHGLLSVGLKIHDLGHGGHFFSLVERLGGALRVLEINIYKHSQASLCLVLPPVGNARTAILLLECIERFTDYALFNNRNIQIQVCSPGRLNLRRSALLAIGFYLGSDTLRRYSCGDLETTVSKDDRYRRGQRLVIYDAGGDFDRGFEWWERSSNGKDRLVRPELPFENGRTDLLIGNGSRLDIENVNLLATLLVHAQHQGYWSKLGEQFEEEMLALLDRHLLAGLVSAPWVRLATLKLTGICLPVWSLLPGSGLATLKMATRRGSLALSKSWSRMLSKSQDASRGPRPFFFRDGTKHQPVHPQAS